MVAPGGRDGFDEAQTAAVLSADGSRAHHRGTIGCVVGDLNAQSIVVKRDPHREGTGRVSDGVGNEFAGSECGIRYRTQLSPRCEVGETNAWASRGASSDDGNSRCASFAIPTSRVRLEATLPNEL